MRVSYSHSFFVSKESEVVLVEVGNGVIRWVAVTR